MTGASRVVCHTATSPDGHIALVDSGAEWIDHVPTADSGYEAFLAGGSLIHGRTTFDQVLDRPYGARPDGVLTTQPLDVGVPPGAFARDGGDPAALVEEPRRGAAGDVSGVGGRQVAAHLMQTGAVDEIETSPAILGSGIRGLPLRVCAEPARLLIASAPFGNGIVWLRRRVEAAAL